MSIDDILEEIIRIEGGYVNDPRDSGGATKYGITQAVARQNGYGGDMRDLPKSLALDIYRRQYVIAPGFNAISTISQPIAAELVDTGVNMGPKVAATFLQRALNALNSAGLVVDGSAGKATCAALKSYIDKRGQAGVTVLMRALNALQGERYISLAEGRPANKAFVYGWINNRVAI